MDWGRDYCFNVQILNSAVYRSVTGTTPQIIPITVEQYRKHGYPFFEIYDEPGDPCISLQRTIRLPDDHQVLGNSH